MEDSDSTYLMEFWCFELFTLSLYSGSLEDEGDEEQSLADICSRGGGNEHPQLQTCAFPPPISLQGENLMSPYDVEDVHVSSEIKLLSSGVV